MCTLNSIYKDSSFVLPRVHTPISQAQEKIKQNRCMQRPHTCMCLIAPKIKGFNTRWLIRPCACTIGQKKRIHARRKGICTVFCWVYSTFIRTSVLSFFSEYTLFLFCVYSIYWLVSLYAYTRFFSFGMSY